MLDTITELTEELLGLLRDDPVRPDIPPEFRVSDRGRVFVLKDDQGQPLAVTCVKLLADIPQTVEDLYLLSNTATTAVFYTIWSYARGAGRRLIEQAQAEIRSQHPEVKTFVTLSPKTEMAERFHLNNGASRYRVNSDTVNYLYH
jgi:hypothetical protein